MPPDHQTQLFGVQRPLSTRVQLSHQEIQLLREIVTYASVIPETTPWNALFHAYDAILRKKGIDAALDDRCFRFLMRLAEVQGTSWYDRYATLLSMWRYDVPPKTILSPMNDPISYSSGQISTNVGPFTITFKGSRKTDPHGDGFKSLPSPRVRDLEDSEDDDEDEVDDNDESYDDDDDDSSDDELPPPRKTEPGKGSVRVNDGRSSPHPSLLQRKKLPPTDGERRKREELEKMKAEFAFPTSLFETTSEVGLRPAEEMETAPTRASFLNREDFEDQNDIHESPEQTAYIPPIRDKAGLIAAAEKAVTRFNNRRITFAGDILKHWRMRTYKAADYHQLQWELACCKDQRVLASQVLDVWRTGVYWKSLERRVTIRRQRTILLRCIDIWRTKALLKAQRKATIDRNMLMRKVFRAWKAHAQSTADKIRQFQLANSLRKWRQRLAQNRAMEEVARRRYDSDLKFRAYWTLFYGYCNIRAPQLNELRLKRFAVQLMQSRIETLRENERIADDLYCFSLLKKYFRMWRSDLAWTRDIAAKADEERRYMLLYKGVLTWRREARYAPLVRQQQGNHDANQATELIALWRSRLRQIKAADHVNKTNVLKTMFRSWRLKLRLKEHENYVKSVYLSAWFDRYSAALADRCYQYHMWRRWLQGWRGRLQTMRDCEAVADDFVDSGIHSKLKLAGVQALRIRLYKMQELEDKANDFRRRRLLAAAFGSLLQKKENVDQLNAISASAAYFLGAKKLVKVWQQTMGKHKRQHRKDAYNQVVRNRALRIRAQAFNSLLAKHESIVALNVTAHDFFESGCKVQAGNLLVEWKERTRDVQELRSHAIEFRQGQLMAFGLEALTKKLQSVRNLYHLAETYNEISRKDRLGGMFKKLKNAQFHRKLESVRADMFRERAEANRRKSIIRSWYWASQERIDRRNINDQLNREMFLEEERQIEEHRQMEAAEDQLAREQRLHTRRRGYGRSEVGERSILGPEGLSMLDVSQWVNSNSAATQQPPSTIARIPQTPSARAARARALLETRNTAAPITRLKLVSTTPVSSPSRKFSKSIAPFRRSISGKPADLRFTQSLSSRLRQEIKEVDDEDEPSIALLKRIDWDENEQLPNIYEADDSHLKMSGGSTTAVATHDSPGR
ncbi:uncharacterized protein DFL_000939 [Arthrobotrys flagrans]|uniref:Sfi1 spindle body domain-containing protein n=1 Tax=Arthrobotrys flagrans TaxID=97331 RepID=A0A437AFP9_ARTFL|nr:hypothetical protein DFL_000939 [Arthrobotrys flagrans]